MITRVKDYTYDVATDLLIRLPNDLETVIDLGAGKRDSPISSQVARIECDSLYSVEAFAPYIPILESIPTKAGVHIVEAVDIIDYIFYPSDVIIMIDVIEHLTKEQALALIRVAQASTKRIIIFTPEGDTIGYSNHDMDNELQTHKSAWTTEEFDELGFDVTVYENFHTHVKDTPVGAIWAVWSKKDANGR